MGCKQSTTRQQEHVVSGNSPSKTGSDAARNVSAFLRVVTKGYHEYLVSLESITSNLRVTLGTVFLNTCVDVVHNNFRMKSDVAVSTIKSIVVELDLEHFIHVSAHIEEHAVDDGLSRLLNAWLMRNKEAASTVPADVAVMMMASMDATRVTFSTPQVSFRQIVAEYYDFHADPVLDEVFARYAGGNELMPDENYSRFLTEVQGTNASPADAKEKIRSRFGGAMTKFSFATYESRSHSNFVLDPRSRDVWQDMMEPLPNYMIRTQSILSAEDLEAAFQQGVRAFVIHCKQREEDGAITTGVLQLRELLETLKARAFQTNMYPVILCFDPAHHMSKSVQEIIARDVVEILGSSLARGMMFDGANINDPQYSPAALQRKFLLMGTQAPLRPFVGFLVADMNRVGLGVRVTDVKEATPAAKAGIMKDDWLTHINGVQIEDKQHLKRLLVDLQLGEEFTMKKENLNEVRVVVGGAISEDNQDEAKHLSDLIYLKISKGGQDGLDSQAPWETSTASVEEMRDTPEKREALQHHLVYLSDPGDVERTPDGRYMTDASNMGVHFMDNVDSRQLHIWSQGKFAENAHCGYVLKNIQASTSSISVHLKVQFLSAPHHLRRKATLRSVKATLFGSGTATVTQDNCVLLDVENDRSVVAFFLDFSTADGATHRFIASFPTHMIRIGYRGMPVMYEDEMLRASTNSPYDVLCFVTHRRPAAAAAASSSAATSPLRPTASLNE